MFRYGFTVALDMIRWFGYGFSGSTDKVVVFGLWGCFLGRPFNLVSNVLCMLFLWLFRVNGD